MSQTKILVKQTTMHPASLGMCCLIQCPPFRQNALPCTARDSLRFLASHSSKLTVLAVSVAEKSSISLSRSMRLSSCPMDLYTSEASLRLPTAESQPFPAVSHCQYQASRLMSHVLRTLPGATFCFHIETEVNRLMRS